MSFLGSALGLTAICSLGWGNLIGFDWNDLPVGREFDCNFLKKVKSPPFALPPPPPPRRHYIDRWRFKPCWKIIVTDVFIPIRLYPRRSSKCTRLFSCVCSFLFQINIFTWECLLFFSFSYSKCFTSADNILFLKTFWSGLCTCWPLFMWRMNLTFRW